MRVVDSRRWRHGRPEAGEPACRRGNRRRAASVRTHSLRHCRACHSACRFHRAHHGREHGRRGRGRAAGFAQGRRRSFTWPRSFPAMRSAISTGMGPEHPRYLELHRSAAHPARRIRRRLCAPASLHLVHRGVRPALSRCHRRRFPVRAPNLLRGAEGDHRTAHRRLQPQGLHGRLFDPAADDLRAAGQAEPCGVIVFLRHHPRAAERGGGNPAGARHGASLACLARVPPRVS